jgi:hypothetical protein
MLIEIRASQSLEKSAALADITHNLPKMLSQGRTDAEILQTVLEKAARHKCTDYIRAYWNAAKHHIATHTV